MMDRIKWIEAFQEEWEKKLSSVDEATQKLAGQIDLQKKRKDFTYYYRHYEQIPEIRKAFTASKIALPSEFMKKYYSKLVDLFVEEDYRKDYYYIIDKMNQFPFTKGMGRRALRSSEYAPWFQTIFELLSSYKTFQLYQCSIYDYLADQLPEEILEIKHQFGYGYDCNVKCMDYMIAARIDLGDERLEELITEIILGDNNTAVVSAEMIRGIVMSRNEKLHKLLADFLLAARLQEGVRQVICESADCGTKEAFLKIFQTVYDNDLIRFAAVKRAVAVWTGLCDLDNADRITNKVLNVVHEALTDTKKALAFTRSNDSIQIMCGLWSLGFHEVQNAIAVMEGYIGCGTRNQLLTMGYYNSMLQYHEYNYKIASKIMMSYPQDYELIAVFMSSFLNKAYSLASQAVHVQYGEEKKTTYSDISVLELYPTKEDAYACYSIMKQIYEQIPKKALVYSPVVFPWHSAYISKAQLAVRMCTTAYALSDVSLMEDACSYLSDIAGRSTYLQLLTHDARSPKLRKYLICAVADKETYTRQTAFAMVKQLSLNEEEYTLLEGFLKYKTAEIRKNVLALLNAQPFENRIKSAMRLLKENKQELRMGGLSILQALHQDKELMAQEHVSAAFGEALAALKDLAKVTDSEQIIINELLGKGAGTDVLNEEGYGLYKPDIICEMPKREVHKEVFQEYFDIQEDQLEKIFTRLDQFFDEHSMLEYKRANGEEVLLGNEFAYICYENVPIQDKYPFKELWIEFYETYIKEPRILACMEIALAPVVTDKPVADNKELYNKYVKELLGEKLCQYRPVLKNVSAISLIVQILSSIYPDLQIANVAKEMINYIVYEVDSKALWFKNDRAAQNRYYYSSSGKEISLISHARIKMMIQLPWHTDEEFKICFQLLYDLDRRFDFNHHEEYRYYNANTNRNFLLIYDYIKACNMGLIQENEIYKAAFEYYSLSVVLSALSVLLLENMPIYQKQNLTLYMKNGQDIESAFYKKAVDVFEHILNKVLDVELSRGDLPTIFSKSATNIKRFYGIEHMVQILVALGKEKLDRNTYYSSSNGDSKNVVLSHLLSVCYPKPEDNAKKLAALLRGKKLSEERLYETVMYAPQWIDIVQDYLKQDLKTGCYYFMAHMNERFDDKKMAVIAKYTPLSAEELNNGAFDLNWFTTAYKTLGEDIFYKLYDAAKYISDGSKHSRARKYADAALGRVTVEDLEAAIKEKRNKDLLMSYGIVPITDKNDVLRRYEFIQEFRKESRQFGAQRKASEGIACDMAMKNLATNAGYQDVTRLVLAMETKMVENYKNVFNPHVIGDVAVRLSVNSYGKVDLECIKKDKLLKSVPTSLKKDEYILYLKEIQKKLKEQYSRTVKMLEQAMEDQEVYTFKEVVNLTKNPVIAPIVNSLVYITCNTKKPVIGMLTQKGLVDYKNETTPLKAKTALRVAHPFDLYKASCWNEYQDYFFREIQAGTRLKQPFKQIFRELYVKLSEEKDSYDSRMFAGNQIQPQKTVGCLKNRRWIADYEEGLQKVYYKDNIIARIYAMADWFSPSDIEAPTLEWVEFSNRITFQKIKISEVPDILYSEVMRDVDLAVSVAHVGGVDPETSHSTMEMRKVIISHNLPLFKLNNVTFEGNHAIIKGKLASYSIHLGSGVIHMLGGHQVYVLPVHSQSRGKIFLPFVDEDPKTAEIMSKIVLFAQDQKIKDPYILNQLK